MGRPTVEKIDSVHGDKATRVELEYVGEAVVTVELESGRAL